MLKSLVFSIFTTLALVGLSNADSTKDMSQYLQDISVTIKAGFSQGSGVVTNVNGVNYVWTAGHVVDGLRKTKEMIDPKTGSKKIIVEFDDAEIVKDYTENGRKIGEVKFLAEVVRFSTSENGGQDLALLRLRKQNAYPSKVKFHLNKEIPAIGTELFHVGSLLGQGGSNSMTSGLYSQIGRIYENQIFDQTSCPAFPGSSGGGVFLKTNGEYVGMIVRGAGETFNLIVPVRRMKEWADKVGVGWTLDLSQKPDEESIRKFPIEDIGASFDVRYRSDSATIKKDYKFLIRKDKSIPFVW